MFIYFLLVLIYLYRVSFSITISSKGTLPVDKDSVALQFYLDIQNEDQVPCRVAAKFKKCCTMDDEQECDSMFLYGRYVEIVEPNDRKMFIFIYPSVFHHDKRGTCYFVVDYKYRHKHSKRKLLEIDFDTRLARLRTKSRELKQYIGHKIIRECDSIDENSLDDCSPVDCQVKYTDEKVFYDVNVNRCVRATTCVGRIKNDLPTLVYLPQVNFCRDLEHPVDIQDIYAINNGMCVITDTKKHTDVLSAAIDSNCTTISEKLGLLEDMMKGKLCPSPKGVDVDYSDPCKKTILSILNYIFGICLCIVVFVFCVNCLMWCHWNWSTGEFDDKCRKFRQKFQRKSSKPCENPKSSARGSDPKLRDSNNVRDKLLRDVITRDIPLELRSSVLDVCDRIGKEVRWKKRYRVRELGAQLGLVSDVMASEMSSTNSLRGNITSEDEKLFK